MRKDSRMSVDFMDVQGVSDIIGPPPPSAREETYWMKHLELEFEAHICGFVVHMNTTNHQN